MRQTGALCGVLIIAFVLKMSAQQPGKLNIGSNKTQNSVLPPVTPGKPQTIDISVSDSRPLASIANELQYKFGVPVSYEDILWVNSADLMPAGQFSNSNNKFLRDPDMPVPALGQIQLSFDIDSNSKIPLVSLEQVLQNAFSDHFRRNNPGEFRLVKLGDEEGYSIVPSKAKDSKGIMTDAKSPLDVRITFLAKERSGAQAISAILEAVKNATGSSFSVLSSVPLGPITIGANNEIARDVLAKVLHESYDWKTYWRIYYGPAEKYWGVNIHALYKETGKITQDGKPEVKPVRWPTHPSGAGAQTVK